jgi:hypothetical protein
MRGPLPKHLPREPMVIGAPDPARAGGTHLTTLSERLTETLEVIPGSGRWCRGPGKLSCAIGLSQGTIRRYV